METIRTLQQAMQYFSDPQRCIDLLVQTRWPDGKVKCPTCGSENVSWVPTRRLFQCKTRHAKCQFSVKVGTVFEDSPIPLGQWLIVSWMLGSCRNGISSYEVARTIGVTQRTAWFMLHRLREAVKNQDLKLSGEVEADETYYGGKLKNKHRNARKEGKYHDKTPIFGMVERGGRVVAMVPEKATASEILPVIAQTVEPKSVVITDAHSVYDDVLKMEEDYKHRVINHHQDSYRRGNAYTNTIENFWSCLKRTLGGTYVRVTAKHLNAYVQEQVFRFNCRKGFTEQQRSLVLLHGIYGKRLTYRELVGR